MKKLYVLLLVTATVFSATQAQTNSDLQFQKGDKLLGGSLGVNHSDPIGSGSNTSLNVAPSFGFFTKPNRLTGFSLFYSTPSLNQSDFYSFGASAYRQYWSSLGKNFYFILQASISGNFTKNVNYTSTSSVGLITNYAKIYTGSVDVAPGFAYRANRRLVVDAFLSNFGNVYFNHTSFTSNLNGGSINESRGNNFGFNSSLNGLRLGDIQIGFRYIF
jgi:hypothetical protein